MKSIKEIEKMNLEELLEASSDESVQVPDGFTARMNDEFGAMMMASALTEDEYSSSIQMHGASEGRNPFRRRMVRIISAAAAVALFAGIGFCLVENEPEDTFDDPYLAYAELEKAFAAISDGIGRGVAMAEDSEKIIGKTTELFK